MTVATVQPGEELLRPSPALLAKRGLLSAAQIDTFFEKGYIVVPSLLSPALLQRVYAALPTVEAAASANPLHDSLLFRVWRFDPVFREIATSSPIAAAAAQLTPVRRAQRGLVVLRDAFSRKNAANKFCNFHVDDALFWPCPPDAPGPGVNAWIALHDVTEEGGGLTVAPRSYLSPFLDCREAIKGKTCMLATIDPEKNARLERIAETPIMKAGDVILHTRWLFHRGNPFTPGSERGKGKGIARYSVRFMPGEAVVKDYTFEQGKLLPKPPVALCDANEQDHPAVTLPAL